MKGTQRCVLLVEDNDLLATTMHLVLGGLGFRVLYAQTARQGLDLLETVHDIDLVLSDIVMPGEMTGMELAARLRDHAPNVPVILMTAFTSAAEDAARAGHKLLIKPFELGELERALRDSLIHDA
jgi:CheY-like chemotaxis protein